MKSFTQKLTSQRQIVQTKNLQRLKIDWGKNELNVYCKYCHRAWKKMNSWRCGKKWNGKNFRLGKYISPPWEISMFTVHELIFILPKKVKLIAYWNMKSMYLREWFEGSVQKIKLMYFWESSIVLPQCILLWGFIQYVHYVCWFFPNNGLGPIPQTRRSCSQLRPDM